MLRSRNVILLTKVNHRTHMDVKEPPNIMQHNMLQRITLLLQSTQDVE